MNTQDFVEFVLCIASTWVGWFVGYQHKTESSESEGEQKKKDFVFWLKKVKETLPLELLIFIITMSKESYYWLL